MVIQHRELSKLKSTYVDALPAAVDPTTGRVHTSYSQTGAVTGRLSSSNPNLQNIPIRTEEGRRIRKGFIAAPGQRPALGGLLADRAAHRGAHGPRRGHAGGLPRRAGHPRHDRRRHLQRPAGRGHQGDAAARQGHQLRSDLRHVGLRAHARHRAHAGRGRELRQGLLRAVPRRQEVPGWHPQVGRAGGLRGDAAGAAPLLHAAGQRRRQRARSATGRSARPSTRPSRAPPRTS